MMPRNSLTQKFSESSVGERSHRNPWRYIQLIIDWWLLFPFALKGCEQDLVASYKFVLTKKIKSNGKIRCASESLWTTFLHLPSWDSLISNTYKSHLTIQHLFIPYDQGLYSSRII